MKSHRQQPAAASNNRCRGQLQTWKQNHQQKYHLKTDDGKRVAFASVMGPNTKRRIAEKSSPAEAQASIFVMSITFQEGIDEYHEKTMRIASANKSSWAASWSCQCLVMSSSGQDNQNSRVERR